jgi:hypothetical protein
VIKTFNLVFGNQTPQGMKVFFAVLISLSLITLPALAWGWRRWTTSENRFTTAGSVLFAAFLFDSVSALLALTMETMVDTGRYFLFDTIMRLGLYLALGGFALSTGIIWRRNPIRWHVLTAAVGAFAYWLYVGGLSY